MTCSYQIEVYGSRSTFPYLQGQSLFRPLQLNNPNCPWLLPNLRRRHLDLQSLVCHVEPCGWMMVWPDFRCGTPYISASKNCPPANIHVLVGHWDARIAWFSSLFHVGLVWTGVFLRWTHRKNVIRIHSWSSCGLGAAFGDFWPIAIVGKQNATKADGSGAKEWLPPAVIPPQLMHLQELLLAAWSWDPGIPVALGWPILLLFGGRKWSNDPVDVGQGNQADTSNS